MREYFHVSWEVESGLNELKLEPGHQFEWVTLLSEYACRNSGSNLELVIERLYEIGDRYGVEQETRHISGKIDTLFSTLQLNSKSWSHAERIRSALVRATKKMKNL